MRSLFAVLVSLLLISLLLISSADARPRHHQSHVNVSQGVIICNQQGCSDRPSFAGGSVTASYEAERIIGRRHGACDGIHRCICGSTQARYYGLPRIVNGHNLWQAAEWPRAFPHTTAHAGAVMYQHGGGPTGHVSRIVQVTGTCTALVVDETGQYERNICIRRAVFVDPVVRGLTQLFNSSAVTN